MVSVSRLSPGIADKKAIGGIVHHGSRSLAYSCIYLLCFPLTSISSPLTSISSLPSLSLIPPLHLPPPPPLAPPTPSSSLFPSCLLLFLLSQGQYKKLFESCQQHYQGEGPTGILLIYPQHCVHLIEAPWRVLRDVIHNLHEMDSNG